MLFETSNPFTLNISQPDFILEGSEFVDAIIEVECIEMAESVPLQAKAVKKAFVFLIDTSGSMSSPAGPTNKHLSKIEAAKNAIIEGIKMIPEDAEFAVVQFAHQSSVVSAMCTATKNNKNKASNLVSQLVANGGTAMGKGLVEAANQFKLASRNAVHQVIFLTDGENQTDNETERELNSILERLAKQFQVEARGVGVNWNVHELERIVDHFNGSVEVIPSAEEITGFFKNIISDTLTRVRREVFLHFEMIPPGTEIYLFRQDEPQIVTLTPKKGAVQNRSWSINTGSWSGGHKRTYRIVFQTPAQEINTAVRMAKVIVSDGDPTKPLTDKNGMILVRWTNDRSRCVPHPKIAKSDGQEEFYNEQIAGIEALEAGDAETATKHFGRAAELAIGNERATKNVETFVKIKNAKARDVSLHPMTAEQQKLARQKGRAESRVTTQHRQST